MIRGAAALLIALSARGTHQSHAMRRDKRTGAEKVEYVAKVSAVAVNEDLPCRSASANRTATLGPGPSCCAVCCDAR